MNNESLPSQENVPVTDEMAIAAMRDLGNPESLFVIERWAKQAEAGVDVIYASEGSEAIVMRNARVAIEFAILKYRAGLETDAIEDLEIQLNAASSKFFEGSGMREQIAGYIEKINAGEPL